ncbi:MAG: glycosyltransferase, partial [Rhodospirillales bacterium]|nr:glycosyltransferase [Rhodospirillales bacterium]
MFDHPLQILALIPVAVWLYLLMGRGGFWRARSILAGDEPEPDRWPPVAAVIPARNEAPCVIQALGSLLGQDYPGGLNVILVDDNSEDGTGGLARQSFAGDGRLEVIDGASLEEGWSGKMWAVHQGLKRLEEAHPGARFVLLCDGDIQHGPDNLRRLVAKAEVESLGLVSLMARLPVVGFWDGLLIPAFVFFFQKLYPFAWVADAGRATAGAAGGCMLVRRGLLDKVGGVTAIRDAIIDDCALARLIKPHAPIWLGLGQATRGLRPYGGLGDIWRMVTRTAFVQLNYSALLLAGTVLAMLIIYIAPPAALIHGWVHGAWPMVLAGLLGWGLMILAYGPTLRRYGRNAVHGLLLPLAALLFTLMTLDAG